MKLSSRAVLMYVVFVVAACAPAPREAVVEEGPSAEEDRRAIQGVINAYWDARMAEDLDAEMDTWADDAQVHRNSQPVLTGKEAIRAWVGGVIEQKDSKFTMDSEEVGVAGDLGYLLGTFTGTDTDQSGEAQTFAGSIMVILRRQSDGTWRITRWIWNNRPSAEQ